MLRTACGGCGGGREERHGESGWVSLAVVQTGYKDGFECQVERSRWILDIPQRWNQQNHWWARCQLWKKEKYQRWLRVFTLSSWENAVVGGGLQEEQAGERAHSGVCRVHHDWGPGGGDVKQAAGWSVWSSGETPDWRLIQDGRQCVVGIFFLFLVLNNSLYLYKAVQNEAVPRRVTWS